MFFPNIVQNGHLYTRYKWPTPSQGQLTKGHRTTSVTTLWPSLFVTIALVAYQSTNSQSHPGRCDPTAHHPCWPSHLAEATSQGCARAPMRQLQVPAQAALWKEVSGVAKLCLCKPCRVSWGVAEASPATCNRWQHFHFFAGLRAREIPVLYSQAVSGPTAPTACQ